MSKIVCPNCGEEKITRHLPKEIGRRLDHEEITIPAEPEPQKRRVSILRITYQRDFLCFTCGYQWEETFETEKQESA